MLNQKDSRLEIRQGFVAFFDIMGFSQMITNNNLAKSARIISDVFHQLVTDVHWERCELGNYNLVPDCLIFSDSILVCQRPALHESPTLRELSRSCFIKFCARLTGEFLVRGLPVRGAVARGKFAIIDGKSFTGKCIIEAHKLAESLEFAGCAILANIETQFIKRGKVLDNSLQDELVYWSAPAKNSPEQKLLILNFYKHINLPPDKILKTFLQEKFGQYGKKLNAQVRNKISHTNNFLVLCRKQSEANLS